MYYYLGEDNLNTGGLRE